MGVISRAKRLVMGGEPTGEPDEEGEPTHVCQTCGEEYFAESSAVEIPECRACGGVKVESV